MADYVLPTDNPVLPRERLIEYMRAVCQLEEERYATEQAIERLKSRYAELGLPRQVNRPIKEKKPSFWAFLFGFIGMIIETTALFFIILFVVEAFRIGGSNFKNIEEIILIAYFVIIAIEIIISPIISARECAEVNKKNRQREQDYEEQLRAENYRLATENNEKQIISVALSSLNNTLSEIIDTLRQLYSVGILHPKYHGDLVAIAEFYDYLSTGQTQGLEMKGTDRGAYYIFENRKMMHSIISRLDEVSRNIKQIQQNQYSLYQAMTNADRKIDSLSRSVIQSKSNLELANHQLAVHGICLQEIQKMQGRIYSKMS